MRQSVGRQGDTVSAAKRPFDWSATRDALKQEYLATLDERVDRYLSVKGLPFTPYHPHFSGASAECTLLFRDGHFLAAISLCQSIAEAVSLLLSQRSHSRSRGHHGRRVQRLVEDSVISKAAGVAFERIHKRRNDFHHLNPGVPTEKRELGRLAKRCLKALAAIEREVFAASVRQGKIRPKYPRYWSTPAA